MTINEHCSLFFSRPIAGYVNLCPTALAVDGIDDEFLFTVTKHEILHALVREYICI